MKKFYLLVLAFLVFISCKEKLIDPPENLIPEDTMTEVLYDLALIKGLRATNANTLENYNIETMPYLYKKYGIDSIQFVHSDQYYASVPEIYQAMYQKIETRLLTKINEIDEARKAKTDSARLRSKQVRDSLRKRSSTPTSQTPQGK